MSANDRGIHNTSSLCIS